MALAKCSLCENMEDPRFGAHVDRRRFPLCDGCGGPETEREAADLFGRLRLLPKATAAPCITCGGEVGEPIPGLMEAKARMGLPLTPPKRCPACVWTSLLKFADSPDDEETQKGSVTR